MKTSANIFHGLVRKIFRKRNVGKLVLLCLPCIVLVYAVYRPKMIRLGTLGGDYSRAAAINSLGQVVGKSETSSGAMHAFIWDEENGMRDLNDLCSLGDRYATAYVINDAGMVGGEYRSSRGPDCAFIWTKEDGVQELGSLGGSVVWPWAICEDGRVVGEASDQHSKFRKFLWSKNEGMKVISEDEFKVLYAKYGRGIKDERGRVLGAIDTMPSWAPYWNVIAKFIIGQEYRWRKKIPIIQRISFKIYETERLDLGSDMPYSYPAYREAVLWESEAARDAGERKEQ